MSRRRRGQSLGASPPAITWQSVEGQRTVVQAFERNGVPYYGIATEGSRSMVLLPASELELERTFDEKNYAQRQASKARSAAQAELEKSLKERHQDTRGFTDGMSDMQRGKVLDNLLRPISSDGVLFTRKGLVEQRVAAGWRVQPSKTGRRFVGPDGSFLTERDLTKTALDYAAYLTPQSLGDAAAERALVKPAQALMRRQKLAERQRPDDDEEDEQVFDEANGEWLDAASGAWNEALDREGLSPEEDASSYIVDPDSVWMRGGPLPVPVTRVVGEKKKTTLVEGLGEQPAPSTRPRTIIPTSELPSEHGYVYHATNLERMHEIAERGLRPHRPHEFTDQSTWPDGGREPRVYFSALAHVVWQFAPEEGEPVILRAAAAHLVLRDDGTGDVYVRAPVSADLLEILTEVGWMPLVAWAVGEHQQ